MNDNRVESIRDSKNKSSFLLIQYKQLHEMRREYNRFIFQAPTIVIAVIAGTFALLFKEEMSLTLSTLSNFALVLILLSGFILVIGYWALRSQILLRKAESSLKAIEKSYGSSEIKMYPYEINTELSWWKKWPSTLFIVSYILTIGIFFFICGVLGLILK